MPAAAPAPTPVAPEPVSAGSDQAGPPGPPSGLSLGQGGGGGTPAIPSDFQFTYYVDRMLALIESKWYKPPVPAGTHAQVRFVISSSGRLDGVELEKSSGVPSFDRAVLRALYAANPLPPLPPAYRKPSLTVHLTFSE
jgi:TonB family protein